MIKKIVSFFRGYLQVKIEGNALERFISQITNADIYLWDIKRIAKDHYRAKMYAEDFNRLRPLVKKRLCRVKILKKIGWHFLLVNMRKRLYLVIGLIIFISIIWVASSFLWFINIQGIDKINREEIVNILNENGVRPGVLKKSVDLEACERLLRQQEPRIIWIDLGWKGTRLNIEIVEKKIVEKTESGDLVATRDGIINEIIVMQGKAVVKEGDTVTEGQTLIVGLKDEKGDKETARGIIKASVWYEETGEAALEYKEPVYTGKEKTSVAIRYNSFLVRFLPRPSYEKYTVDRSISKPFKWRNYSLPLEFIIEDYKQVEYLYYNRSEETAFYLARREAFEKILDKMDSEAIIIDVKTKKLELSGNRVGIKILLKTEENIGVLNNADKEDMSG